jgi:hypothetical protein
VTAAIFGLLGVVVGGVLSGVVTWLLQRNQTASASRAIARLAYDDFLHFQSTLVRALAAGEWWDRSYLLEPQVTTDDWKLLLGQLKDEPSQEVAGARGWMAYLTSRGAAAPDNQAPSQQDLQIMRDTFCRLDRGRWQLSGTVSGRRFSSFERGGVLATLEVPRDLAALGISEDACEQRREAGYGRELPTDEAPD